MTRFFEYILESFGYANLQDSGHALFGFVSKGSTLLFCTVCGTLIQNFESIIGIEAKVYVAMVALWILEFLTGVSASIVVKGEKFSSYKMGRIVVKIVVYSTILVIFNILKDHLGGIDVLHIDFNFFQWMYYIVLNLVILQLIVSVFENLEKLGWSEAGVFVKIFKRQFHQTKENIEAKTYKGKSKKNKKEEE